MLASISGRVNTFLLVLVALMGATIIGILATRAGAGPLDPPAAPGSTAGVVEPGTPITSIPFTINTAGFYYLTGNLSMAAPGDGITINTYNTTLDLKGFTLTGAGQSGSGIISNGHSNVIRDGHVRNWNDGVQLGSGIASNITAVDNVTGFAMLGGTAQDCTAWSNQVGVNADTAVIEDCDVETNFTAGLVLNSRSEVRDSKFFYNGSGGAQYDIEVHLNDNVIRQNYTTLSPAHEDFIGVFPGATNTLIIRNRWNCSNGIVDNGTKTFLPNALSEDTNYCF